jgi:hypothetical protein
VIFVACITQYIDQRPTSTVLPILYISCGVGSAIASLTRGIAKVKDEDNRKKLLDDAIVYNFSLNEIKRKIKEIGQQVKPETPSTKDKVDYTFRKLKQSKVWVDPKKKVKVEKLLAQLDALMVNDPNDTNEPVW